MASKTKVQRTMRLEGDKLRIVDDRSDETYTVQRIAQEGETLGFRLTKKSTGDAYDVELATGECTCMGFLRWGKPCKHVASVCKLRELRML